MFNFVFLVQLKTLIIFWRFFAINERLIKYKNCLTAVRAEQASNEGVIRAHGAARESRDPTDGRKSVTGTSTLKGYRRCFNLRHF